TLELGQRVLQHGQPERAVSEVHALELLRGMVDGLGGEARRHGLVVPGEDVHREVLGGGQGRIAVRVMGDAHEDEGGLQRDGGEGAGGETRGPTLAVPRGDDGDARAEVTEHTAEFIGRNHSSLVTVSRRFFNFFAELESMRPGLFLDGREERTLYFVQGSRPFDRAPRRRFPWQRHRDLALLRPRSFPRSSTLSRSRRARAESANPPWRRTSPSPSSRRDMPWVSSMSTSMDPPSPP